MTSHRPSLKLSVSLLACLLFTAPIAASAQTADNAQTMERMDRLERDLMLLHKQLARGETVAPVAGDDAGSATSGQLEIRLSAIEEQLRDLRGKIEENENRSRKNADALEKFQKDTEFRFNELSTASAAATTAKPDAKSSSPAAEKAGGSTGGGTVRNLDADAKAGVKGESEPKPKGDSTESNFTSPREHYNYAFRLLNQTQYEESATAFESFTKKYPKDPLVGNAYYWEGETYYIRRDYVKAADNFRKGFEALPEGPKAADNLLKLAMSLNAQSRDKEACLVLQQVSAKFKKSSASVVEKADQEQKRIGCHKT